MFLFLYLLLVWPVYIQVIGGVTQDIYWRNYIHGDIPCDAYQGAPGKYIGQFNARNFDLVGTIYTETGVAVATHGDKISVEKDIRILCSSDHSRLHWEYIDVTKAQDTQLQNAVIGGFQENAHYNLFIGKAIHEGEWRIGKVFGYQNSDVIGLWVWGQNGKHFNFRQFFILKYNVTSSREGKCSTYIAI